VGVALLIGGYFVWFSHPGAETDQTINYNEATSEEKQAAEDHKKEVAKEQERANASVENNNNQDDKKSVIPLITAWGQATAGSDFKLNGFVPDIIETNGSCTLTMTRGNNTVSKSRVALADAKNTTCGQTIIPFGELEPGQWIATLSYESSGSAGVSETTVVEVK
jgi:hypothetical protein